MTKKDYSATIQVNASGKDAFQKIAKVNEWWAKDFEGNALQVNDAFTVRFGSTWVNFLITEAIPDKKIVWQVTDCFLHWLNDKKEWKGTKVVWDLAPANGSTTITMTHVGLTPGIECYANCEVGWNGFIKNSLPKLIGEGKGLPE